PLFRKTANGFSLAESSHDVVVKCVISVHPRIDKRMDPGLRRDDDGGFRLHPRYTGPVRRRTWGSFDTASCAGMTLVVSVAPDAHQARVTKDHRAVLTRPRRLRSAN